MPQVNTLSKNGQRILDLVHEAQALTDGKATQHDATYLKAAIQKLATAIEAMVLDTEPLWTKEDV
jgi:hypothetical protein